MLAEPYGILKKHFCLSQDKVWTLSNKRPSRLRDNLTELEDILSHQTIVEIEWSTTADHGIGFMVFHNGIIIHITVDLHSSDLINILIDKTLEGKLLGDIASASASLDVIVLAHGIPQLTVIQANQPLMNSALPTLLGQNNVTVNGIQLPGPTTRRQERKVTISPNRSSICVWWEREGNEIFAWAPVVRAEDRANILIYSLVNLELIACHYSEHNPIAIEFLANNGATLRVTELMSSVKGHISIVSTVFSINQPFKQIRQQQIRLSVLPRCHSYSPDQQILLLGCVDATIIAWNLTRDTHCSIKASFIPFHLRWHSSSSFFVMSSERGQLQCWDRALNPLLIRLRNAIGSREGAPVVHLQQYLRHQPSIASLRWSNLPQELNNSRDTQIKPVKPMRHKSMRSSRNKLRSRSLISQTTTAKAAAHHLFISFERGPVLCLEFLTSCWPANSALGSLSLCSEFLIRQQFDAAIQHLLSLNWTKVNSFQEEDLLLNCFMKVGNVLLLRSDGDPASADILERLVMQLLNCAKDDEALVEPIFDFARRCCRLMLRKKRVDKAAVYATRLEDMDLLVESILHAQAARDEALVRQLTTVLDYVRDSYSSTFSSSSGSSRSLSYTSSVTSSSLSCSTCDENLTVEIIQPQFSHLQLGVHDDDDRVHVISFGEV